MCWNNAVVNGFSPQMVAGLPGVAYRLKNGERWQIVEIGDQILDLTGYSASDFLQRKKTFFELAHPEDLQYVRDSVNASLKDGGQFSIEYRIHTRSGEVKYLWERGQGIFDDDGQLLEIVGFAFDSSDHQKQLQRTRDFQDLLLDLACSENLRQGDVASFSRECLQPVAKVMEASRVSVWWVSVCDTEMIQECLYHRATDAFSFGEVLKVSDCPNYYEQIFSGRSLNVVDVLNDPRTQEQTVSGYFQINNVCSLLDVPIRKGSEVVGVVSVEQEGCKRRWTREEASLVNELADLLNQTLNNKELRKAEDRLLKVEAANKAKNNFLGIMSHELRTPLNGVLGIAELLNMTGLNEQQREYVMTIEESGRHLLQVISAVVDLANLQDGTLELDEGTTDVRGLLRELIQAAEVQARNKPIDVRLTLDESVPDGLYFDGQRVQQIVHGLLSNAVRYTDQGFVSLDVDTQGTGQGKQLVIRVTDSGQGIAEDIQGDLFNPFVQIRKVRLGKALQGAGLGLAICHELVKLMSGQLAFKSEVGKGTTFTLTLPLVPAKLDKHRDCKPVEELKTLVVEDDKVNQLVATGMLKKFGIEADVCADGAEAVDLIRQTAKPYDLILMDCEMPVMNGFDATREIRQLSRPHAETYIAALTAHAMSDYRSRALKSGIDEFLTKPLNQGRLEKLLNDLACNCI
jgi:signal transduction histidine kinase/ActR/RegA family two-component response regulator